MKPSSNNADTDQMWVGSTERMPAMWKMLRGHKIGAKFSGAGSRPCLPRRRSSRAISVGWQGGRAEGGKCGTIPPLHTTFCFSVVGGKLYTTGVRITAHTWESLESILFHVMPSHPTVPILKKAVEYILSVYDSCVRGKMILQYLL